MTFFGETEHFSGRIGALRWSILVGKQKHNVQKPIPDMIMLAINKKNSTYDSFNGINYYSMSVCWIRVGYKYLTFNKHKWNYCFLKKYRKTERK